MAFPLLALLPVIKAALAGVTASGLLGAATSTIVALKSAEGVAEWFESTSASEMIADLVNKKMAAAGVDLNFPPFNPATEEGRAVVARVLGKFAAGQINAKAGTDFSSLEGLNQDSFMAEMGGMLANKINGETGAQLLSVWPVDKLKSQLQTEVMRQFDNRGRYAGGRLFPGKTMAAIKEKITLKNPELMAQVKAQADGGYWGAPKDEKHRLRRESGKARQDKYRQTHQQVWEKK